ncbi:MAG: hypothetical protein QXH42_06040 [Thermoplasmata archaeon]
MLIASVRNQGAEGPSIIDREFAEQQIELCEAELKEELEGGTLPHKARLYLEKAREHLRQRQYAKALFWAMKARGVTAELLLHEKRRPKGSSEEE